MATAPSTEPTASTKRPPRRSTSLPDSGDAAPETSNPAVNAPKRYTSLTPTSRLIAGPSTPIE
jgi:hypothetical protein